MTHKKLLIIGFVWPEPKSSAAGSRMLQLITCFNALHYNITFASACSKTSKAFHLESIGILQEHIKLNDSSFDVFIKTLNPDVVLFDRFMTEEQFGWRVAKQCPHALRVLDTEDLHGLRKGRQMAFEANELFNKRYLYNTISKREIASIYRSDLSLIISEAEMSILKQDFKVDDTLLLYLPFMLDTVEASTINKFPKFEDRNHFVTIGNFLHQPNYKATLYLKHTLWPLIRTQLPDAELHIYGAYATQKVNELHDKKQGFLIKAFTEDVNTMMQNAKVCVAPLPFGAGLKGKLFDAMRNGTPSLTTTIGAEGISGTLEFAGFIENEPEDFANKAVSLYTNETLWNNKQQKGFQIINAPFSKYEFHKHFINKINDLVYNLDNHRLYNFTGQMLMYHALQSTKYMSKWIEEKNRNN